MPSMSRTEHCRDGCFCGGSGLLLSIGPQATRKIQASVFPDHLAFSEDRLGLGATDHLGSQRA